MGKGRAVTPGKFYAPRNSGLFFIIPVFDKDNNLPFYLKKYKERALGRQ
jgi:hypothetical protein